MKIEENIFKIINQKIIAIYAQQFTDDDTYKWLGHRTFAVDGSKINLPRKLLSEGFELPSKNANYPQGLLSCLYQLKSQMPFDFDFVSHGNERTCAQDHLKVLEKDDVVVYDRGYFSYAMLNRHHDLKIHAIFRLQKNSYKVISDFLSSNDTDIVVTIDPLENTHRAIKSKNPNIKIIPIKMRLLKYQVDGNVYCLGTTLIDQKKYSNIQDFIEVYHARWGIEELYKISKRIFNIEDFHAKSKRGVKQEIFAHFVLITMNRIFANQADVDLNYSTNSTVNTTTANKKPESKTHSHMIKTNFKNCIQVFSRSMEELLLLETKIATVIDRAYQFIVGRNQKARPDRSYERKSMKPESKWRLSKEKKQQLRLVTAPT